jgi:hypothetical protein
VGIAAFDTLVWQALASVIVPGKGIKTLGWPTDYGYTMAKSQIQIPK